MVVTEFMSTCAVLVAVLAGLGTLAWRARLPRQVLVVTVIDGDTLLCVDNQGRRRKLRIKGIDALEKHQRGGPEAASFLQTLVQGRWVTVRWRGRDRFGRHLVRLTCPSGDVATLMVKAGHAFPTEGGMLALRAAVPWLLRKGVWGQRHRPHQDWRRKYRLLGWLSWKVETALRRRKRR